jgi:Right handed beta helix region
MLRRAETGNIVKLLLLLLLLLFGATFFMLHSSASGPRRIVRRGPASSPYYVSPSGNDANLGTINTPWRTLSYAAGRLVAGDILYIRGGTYQEKVNFSQSGTDSQPITIAAYPGETPVIDGNYTLPAATPIYSQLVTFSGSYIQADGLVVRNSYWAGVTISGTNVTLSHFTSHDNLEAGILTWGSTDAIVQDSIAYNNAMSFRNGVYNYSGRRSHATGISAGKGSNRSILRRNKIYNNWGEGLDTFNAINTTAEDNIIYDNAKEVYVSDTTGALVQRNLIYCTPRNRYRLSSAIAQHGINLQDENQQPASTNNTIVNNFVVGCVDNFKWHPYTSNSSMQNILIANNTFINATGTTSDAAFTVGSPVGIAHSNTKITNNIVVQDDSRAIGSLGDRSAGITFSNNLWSKSPPSSMMGRNSLVGDPLITKTGYLTPGNLTGDYFEFLSSSPAINKAATLAAVTVDYFGTSRPQGSAPDIGAFEYSPAGSSGAMSHPDGFCWSSSGTGSTTNPPAVVRPEGPEVT